MTEITIDFEYPVPDEQYAQTDSKNKKGKLRQGANPSWPNPQNNTNCSNVDHKCMTNFNNGKICFAMISANRGIR